MKKSLLLLSLLLLWSPAWAQSGALEGLKASTGKNKEALAHYTWQEQVTLSVDGEVKRTTVSQVMLDSNGQPQKTQISEQSAPQKQGKGPIRRRIRERKADDFKDYIKSVMALAQAYAHPDPSKLEQAFKDGKVKMDDSAGSGKTRFVISGYLKPGDSLTMVYDRQAKALLSVTVDSYIDSPDDKVSLSTNFAQLQDATNHVAQTTIVGEDKQVTIDIKNSGYAKR